MKPVRDTDRAVVETPTSPFESIQRVDTASPGTADFPFSSGEVFSNLRFIRSFPGSYFAGAEETRDKARTFSDRHIRPVAVEIDRRVSGDPGYFHWDIMKEACKYADTGLKALVEKMKEAGSEPSELKAKLVGGASMFAVSETDSIGTRNIQAVKTGLKQIGIPTVFESTGGTHGRKVVFHCASGKIKVHCLCARTVTG